MTNPYISTDASDDIIARKRQKEQAGKNNNTSNYKDIPDQEKEEENLQEWANTFLASQGVNLNIDDILSDISESTQILVITSVFSEYFTVFSEQQNACLLTGMARLLNEMNNGALEIWVKYEQTKQNLLYFGTLKDTLNLFQRIILSKEESSTLAETNLTIYLEIISFLHGKAREDYVRYSTELGQPLDEMLLTKSILTQRDMVDSLGLDNPPAMSQSFKL